MKIAIDARWIFPEISGIGSYTRELIRYLALIDRDNQYVVFFANNHLLTRTVMEIGLLKADNFTSQVLPYGLFSLRSQTALPPLLTAQKIDVFHSPNYMIPLRAFPRNRPGRIRCVVTLHDLIPLIFPDYAPHSRKRRLQPIYRLLMYQVGMRADVIITVSQNSQADVIRHLRIPPARQHCVLAIPEGVASRFQPASKDQSAAPRNRKVILWVGRPEPYKNLIGVIEAFARLREGLRFPAELRLVGPSDPRYPEGPRRVAQLHLEEAVTWAGYLSEDQLLKEYQQADVFVMPSFYEGFGLPVLEAMACGTPVICSNKGSLPEVAGHAALKVQPQDMVGLAEAMRRVLTEPRLAQDLSARGIQQAAKFTWTATAQQTLAAYWKALA